MTLKFESEILFDLMKRDGDDAPSDVLPYESELKEKYLNQVVGAYPKLQDYRPEWLNYNLYHHLPSDFPTESVTNVTSASFHDVVPYAYGSAILKGQTLVNLTSNDKIYYQKAPADNWNDIPITINTQRCSINIKNIKPNTTYLIKTLSETKEFYIKFFNETPASNRNTGWLSINSTFTTLSDTNKISISFRLSKENEDYTDVSQCSNILLLEYQDGMENWDIDYFEGMQSVKMPVLKTTGKNLFNYFDVVAGEIIWNTSNNVNIFEDGWYRESAGGVGFRLRKCIKVKPNTKYYANFPQEIHVMQYKANGDLIKGSYPTISTGYVTTSSETHYINLFPSSGISSVWDEAKRQEYQNCYISESEAMTSYEPYKSNILTVNEEVELGSVGNVYDTLDLLTGKVIKRTDTYTYKGETEPYLNSSIGGYVVYIVAKANVTVSTGIISDKFINRSFTLNDTGVYGNNNGAFYFFDKLVTSAQEFKEKYIGTTFRFELKEESVKTVDLTCINEQGESETLRPIEGTMHVNTSSQTLPPLLDMSVPVEATSQNLMSFANIVEEEK